MDIDLKKFCNINFFLKIVRNETQRYFMLFLTPFAVIKICVQYFSFRLPTPFVFRYRCHLSLPECNEKTNDNNGTEKVTLINAIQV